MGHPQAMDLEHLQSRFGTKLGFGMNGRSPASRGEGWSEEESEDLSSAPSASSHYSTTTSLRDAMATMILVDLAVGGRQGADCRLRQN